MKKILISSAFFVALAFILSTGTAFAAGNTLVNPGFETGDLTGWTDEGDAFATTSYTGTNGPTFTAPWDDYFGVVIASCYTTTLYQSFDAKAGSNILGWSFFKANDYLPYDDTGEVKLIITSNSGTVTLFASKVRDVGNYGSTPWMPWMYTFPANDTYQILVESTNTTDCILSSAVGIDIAQTGGMVTGGGWINSPAGAYKPDDLLEGKANFGFMSKYKKGAKVPTGNTEFQFQTGDLNFHSDTYDWLIVNQNGDNAQFKGKGTINGAGNYGFMLWAQDHANIPDTFRIKIWDKDDNDTVIYDNGVNQILGGGNIVIHIK